MGIPQDYGAASMDETAVTTPFPANTKQAARDINGLKTDVMYMSFADKIMITITQEGRLGQWVPFNALGMALCIWLILSSLEDYGTTFQ
jgi:hypothetical protein